MKKNSRLKSEDGRKKLASALIQKRRNIKSKSIFGTSEDVTKGKKELKSIQSMGLDNEGNMIRESLILRGIQFI